MGCDIHIIIEEKVLGIRWQKLNNPPFNYRSYAVFAFLADVRNRTGIIPISNCR